MEKEDKKRIGERIRRLRKAKKMTARELGEKIGVAESTLVCYEQGISSPSLPKLKKLAGVLNVSTDFLLSDNEQELRNLRSLLESNDLNWNGRKLTENELDQLKNFLEYVIREKLPKAER